jgi:uncharacterized protein with HEPN domain
MTARFDRDFLIFEQILEMIGHIDRRLQDMSEAAFVRDQDEVDLTAYRLQVIGEATRKLSDVAKSRHPEIDWASIYAMRNIIAHDYGSIVPARVWLVADRELEPLAAACRVEMQKSS